MGLNACGKGADILVGKAGRRVAAASEAGAQLGQVDLEIQGWFDSCGSGQTL